ncbi:hypothetical protein MRB53_013908 [Persea americana]|uniref:Uncharacterized protein n=1 Tax=Persea americana TaxID=3435 RepID=A0ACC2K9Q4_PERAE|nr:hypothetical protein MRB53_013908 [Persea americana]
MSKNALEQVWDTVVRLEETVDGLFETIADHISHSLKIVALTKKVGSLEMSLAEVVTQMEELKVDMQLATDFFKEQMESFSDEVILLKRAIRNNGFARENRKGWGQEELRRQGVKDLPSAMAAAEALVDFKAAKAENNDARKPNNNKGGSQKGKKKKNGDGGSKEKQPQNGNQQGKPSKADSGCFICKGPHRAHDCSKKEKLNALVAEEERKQEETSRVNPLQLLNAIQSEGPSQKNWVDLLDTAQFCYNLHHISVTVTSPFELATSQQPLAPHEVAKQKSQGSCPAAYQFARERTELVESARDCLKRAVRRMKKWADKNRSFREFQVGDKVMLKLTPKIWKKIRAKEVHKGLIPRYDGPFEIVLKVGKVAYRLSLLQRIKVHPVFHVSFLKPYHEVPSDASLGVSRRAPPTIRAQFDRKIQKILADKTEGESKKNRRTSYLVQWEGAEESEASWEKGTTLWQFEKEIKEYLAQKRTRTSVA